MFQITSNKSIRINRGDDSPKFPLFLNIGSAISPQRYELSPAISITKTSTTITEVHIDEDVWKTKCPNDGFYSFYYDKSKWWFGGVQISLSTFGISIIGQATSGDSIGVTVSHKDIEVYFYLIDYNDELENYIFKKVFNINGTISTYFKGSSTPVVYVDKQIINENGDILLHFDGTDTEELQEAEYRYVIKAKIFDWEIQKYVLNTVTNRLPFYLIDER